jgi:lipopolysaccharide/colanic/teichoic acid biosynthesis glycosyltransferase
MVKRLMDLLVSLLALIVLSPFFLIIALIIKIYSPGPVFYQQDRVGVNGKLFKLFKFRSMRIDSDKHAAITIGKRDPRITGIGYFLRKFKLDEMPQLINIIKGDMSLVGPRPEVEKFVKLYDQQQLRVLSIRPGLTDYASIEFRNENELLEGKTDPIDFYVREIMPVKLNLNLKYIENRSVWTDFKILFKTVFLVILRK